MFVYLKRRIFKQRATASVCCSGDRTSRVDVVKGRNHVTHLSASCACKLHSLRKCVHTYYI